MAFNAIIWACWILSLILVTFTDSDARSTYKKETGLPVLVNLDLLGDWKCVSDLMLQESYPAFARIELRSVGVIDKYSDFVVSVELDSFLRGVNAGTIHQKD